MSGANGGSLDDCITNLFALTELNGLQWRMYESPPGSMATDPNTVLQSDPVLHAYSKLQTDGVLSVWRRMPAKELPQIFPLPALFLGTPKELWVFWYGTTEPEEIQEHCKDLISKKNEDEGEDGTPYAIPYDVRCLLYKAWNTQIEKHYRSKRFLQIGRWFFRPVRFFDPNAAFVIDDFALAHCHSFNVVGGNSMCMAIRTQLQPNLVRLSPFHIERDVLYRERVVAVVLAPWSLKGQLILKYSVVPASKQEEEEVERQLSQWKEANMFTDAKKRKKKRKEDGGGGETEGEESEDEGWGKKKMPKMVRVEVEGGQRMWWPTQYVLVTLEESRRLVRDRFIVSSRIKCIPDKEPKIIENRFAYLSNSEAAMRITQAVVDDGNLNRRARPNRPLYEVRHGASCRCRACYRAPKVRRDKVRVSYEERTRRKLEREAMASGRRVRISSVNSDDEMEGVEEGGTGEKKNNGMKRELKRVMKSRRYNWRDRHGRPLSRKETELRSFRSDSDNDEAEEKDGEGKEETERQWMRTEKEKEGERGGGDYNLSKDMNTHVEQAAYHFAKSSRHRSPLSDLVTDGPIDHSLGSFTPVSALSPCDKTVEMDTMAKLIVADLKAANEKVKDHLDAAGTLNEYGGYYDLNAAFEDRGTDIRSYHSKRVDDRRQPPYYDKFMAPFKKSVTNHSLQELADDRSDLYYYGAIQRSPTPPRFQRAHVVPQFESEKVGGVKEPPHLTPISDKVVRAKRRPKPSVAAKSPLVWPAIEENDDVFGVMDRLVYLTHPTLDLGSDEEPSDDRTPLDYFEPVELVGGDDAGEGTSSGAENWRDEEMEVEEDEHMHTHLDSSGDLIDSDGLPLHTDSVLSPPASNERADSNNSMYHRLAGGPHSVGETALNKIYPTPPSILQVDICSPAMLGGPHSQARKDEREENSSDSHPSDDEEILREVMLMRDEDAARGDDHISHLHSELGSRRFFDNAPKTSVPFSTRFGSMQARRRLRERKSITMYNKKDGERKEEIPQKLADVVARIDYHTSKQQQTPSTSGTTTTATGNQPWQAAQLHPSHAAHGAPMPHPAAAAHHPAMQMHQQQQYLNQMQPQMPGPSSMMPPQMQHPGYQMGGAPGQMGSYPMMAGGGPRPPHYPPQYGAAMQGMQPVYPSQYQPQMPGGQNPMMMTPPQQPGQPGYHGLPPQMRMGAGAPPGYPTGPHPYHPGQMGGVHPMQAPGMAQQMGGYPAGMSPQMMYRPNQPGMQHQQPGGGSFPPQYGSPMGGMMAPPPVGSMGGAMGGAAQGMQMGAGGGQTMGMGGGMGMGGQYGQMPHQQGMMMSMSGQPMIAGAPHPMGSGGAVPVQPYQMAGSIGAAGPASSAVSTTGMQQLQQVVIAAAGPSNAAKGKEGFKFKQALIRDGKMDDRALFEARMGTDPYAAAIWLPKRLHHKYYKQFVYFTDLAVTELGLKQKAACTDLSPLIPTGGAEGLSIVAAVMLQDTILNLHFDWVFDSCPICACTMSIKARELGVYISPPDVLQERWEVQSEWIGPWHGFHSDTPTAQCTCGFSSIRHRLLSMRSGLFLEDSREATGDDRDSGTNPVVQAVASPHHTSLWFNPTSSVDRALVETLRSVALTTDLGRFVSAIKVNTRTTKERRSKKKKSSLSVGSIGCSRSEYVISQMDRAELLFMGNSSLSIANTSGTRSLRVGESPFFHPWGLQIASDMADPSEMEIKCLLDDVKPLIEGAVREARKIPSSPSSSAGVEGPLTWRALAAKNVKSSGNGDDDSHIAEPIPFIEMSTEKEAIRVAPTIIKHWEHFGLGPIDVPKDVIYLAVSPDDDRIFDMSVVYMRRMSKMYEQNLRLGRHIPYLIRPNEKGATVKEGVLRANRTLMGQTGYGAASNPASSLEFVNTIERYATSVGCTEQFVEKLKSYVLGIEEVLFDVLSTPKNGIFERHTFRECLAYNLYFRRIYKSSKLNDPNIKRHEKDSEEGSPPPVNEEETYTGALADALGVSAGSGSKKKERVKNPFGQQPALSMMENVPTLTQNDWPEDEHGALPQVVVIYLTMWPGWGSDGRDAEAARVTTLALVKAFNAVMMRLPPFKRGLCQLELVPMQRLQEVVGSGADMDRIDRSNNLNTWQMTNMMRNAEIFAMDRPRIEDVMKEVAVGVYRKPRFIHRDYLKTALPKSMTKFGPASGILDWIEDGSKEKQQHSKTFYRVQSVPYQLSNTPAIVAKTESKYAHLCLEELSLYISYCLVGTEFVVATLTDSLGARNESAVLNLKAKSTESGSKFRSRNKTTVRDGLDKLWKFIEGAMMSESKPIRLVIGKLGKMGHGEFKAWCHILSRSNLKKYSTRLRESCTTCNSSGAPILLSACLISTEPEAHLQVLPSYFTPVDPASNQKKIRPLHTPGDNTITHIMVFPTSADVQLIQSADVGGGDDFDGLGDFDVGLGGDDMNLNDLVADIMAGDDGEGGERAAMRNAHANSFFDGALEAGVPNQPLASGWMISTAPGGELPDWFWSSCPSLKRRLPVHLRSSLHINESQLLRSDDMLQAKKEKEQEGNHALDSQKTDEVLRHVLEQYNDLSWLSIDPVTHERKSCLPIHIQSLTRLHDTVLHLIM
ncbi:hypothetical protein PFISCL1PPCAC_7813 [Pristionchus fissidentatus]|uniref:Mediator of RNA polymerase II transcription subunit 13 n=1 Tax=Pristionchus fissidentatus TaxID=1538716 RepID=A0AAV5VA39_9BILA|nr:hypothetical protein PFISCL1PPCAC_7813 [Pristionchus fissidentatus]